MSNIKEVIDAIKLVINNNQTKLAIIWQFSGGWEIWLQCEVAYILHEKGITVFREEKIWGDSRACDLYFPDNLFAAELKCPSLNRVQTSKKFGGQSIGSTDSGEGAFADEVIIDKAKLAEVRFGNSVSICVLPDSYIGMQGICMKLASAGYSWERYNGYMILAS